MNIEKNNLLFAFLEIDNKERNIYKILDISESFCSLINKNRNDIINKNTSEILLDTFWCDTLKEVLIENFKEKTIKHNILDDKWYNLSVYVANDKYLTLTINDITETVLLNKKVNNIHKTLDQILNITSPLCVINKNNDIILVNDSLCNLFKIDKVNIEGKKCFDIFGTKMCNNHCPLLKIHSNNKSTIERNIKINNKLVKCLVTTKTFESDNDEMIGIVETFTDITKLKRIEYNLLKSKLKAEESDRLKSSFLANMSHEIRTPMNSIIGFSDLLNEDDIDLDTKKSYLNIIQKAGNDLLNLIDDIIDIAKVEAGQMKLKIESVCINKILEDTYSLLNEHPNLKANNVEFRLIKNKDNYNYCVLTDSLRFKQVLVNIINNAIKFTHKGFIEFGYDKNDDNLEFYVKDTGIGMTNEQLNIIWDRFRQADESTTKKYGGAGLGLSISKGLIKLLGGKIWVESTQGKGTTFRFTIPYNESKPKESTDIIINNKFIWDNYTILIAEDVDINFMLIQEILKETNVNLIRAKNGQECINIFKKNKNIIDLILMDIQMPVLNGNEAMKIIKRIKNIPIIAQSAYAMIDDIKKSQHYGCDDYITKPIIKSKLIEIIDKFLK